MRPEAEAEAPHPWGWRSRGAQGRGRGRPCFGSYVSRLIYGHQDLYYAVVCSKSATSGCDEPLMNRCASKGKVALSYLLSVCAC
eukprot:scaffold1576_cov102-Isochrysis_galbana.AAC.7